MGQSRTVPIFSLHKPILVREVIELLKCQAGKIIVDATIGSGGHSVEILENILPGGYLIGIDADGDAIRRAEERLISYKGNYKLYRDNYRNLEDILKKENIEFIDGLLLDLGVASEQLEDQSRGFSFVRDGPLDMRYDTRGEVVARDIINSESREELLRIFESFGEERKAGQIASLIIEKRKKAPVETTLELARIAARAKAFSAKEKINPATRIFQALRIYVNKELENLEKALTQAIRVVSRGGRVCVLSYHSLEDRIVKNFFKEEFSSGKIKIITPHPIVASRDEVVKNRRSRSARLRAAEII